MFFFIFSLLVIFSQDIVFYFLYRLELHKRMRAEDEVERLIDKLAYQQSVELHRPHPASVVRDLPDTPTPRHSFFRMKSPPPVTSAERAQMENR